jgi:hypothetical protein
VAAGDFTGDGKGDIILNGVKGWGTMPLATGEPSKIHYVGCFKDDAHRDLKHGPKKYGYTPEMCINRCKKYKFAALQNGGWCSCDNTYSTPAKKYPSMPLSQCNKGGKGKGGPWRNAVYTIHKISSTSKKPSWKTVISGWGKTKDDAKAIARCPKGTLLTGCACHSPWKGCDGSVPSGNHCTAYKGSSGGKARAWARCAYLKGKSLRDFKTVASAYSGTRDDQTTTAKCPRGYTITGCSCHSWWKGCDGATIKGNACVAHKGAKGGKVKAHATCAKGLGGYKWKTIRGKKSGKADDAPSRVKCPGGSKLTGCMCWSPWQSCDGAEGKGDTCTAYNSFHGNGVFATARCVYVNSKASKTAPKATPEIGCYKDTKKRDLPVRKKNGSLASCKAQCKSFKFFGRQWTGECYCGNKYGKYGKATGCKCKAKNQGGWKNCVYATGSTELAPVASLYNMQTSLFDKMTRSDENTVEHKEMEEVEGRTAEASLYKMQVSLFNDVYNENSFQEPVEPK